MKKKSCVIYDSWADQIINLPVDMAGELTQKIFQYAIYGEEVAFDNPALYAMFVPIKKRLDEDSEKYFEKVNRIKTNSKRNQDDIETKSKRNRSDIGGVNDNDNVNVNDKKYIKPDRYAKIHNFSEREINYTELVENAKSDRG